MPRLFNQAKYLFDIVKVVALNEPLDMYIRSVVVSGVLELLCNSTDLHPLLDYHSELVPDHRRKCQFYFPPVCKDNILIVAQRDNIDFKLLGNLLNNVPEETHYIFREFLIQVFSDISILKHPSVHLIHLPTRDIIMIINSHIDRE